MTEDPMDTTKLIAATDATIEAVKQFERTMQRTSRKFIVAMRQAGEMLSKNAELQRITPCR